MHWIEKFKLDSDVLIVETKYGGLELMRETCNKSCIFYISINEADFNHGGTRNLGAQLASERGAEILVFMTQDAVPAGPEWLDRLVAPIRSGEAVATFARQLPRPEASVLEEFSRHFNYPAQSRLRTRADIPEMGVKAFFFSNVCSAVRTDVFWELGGFPDDVIMNEDMLMAAKVLRAGYAIKYVAGAEVVHSHDYSLKQQFRRNFDVGAFFADAGGMLEGAAVGGEGFRFVREQLRYVLRRGRPDLLPLVVLEAGAKFSAFQLGKRHRFLPLSVKKRMSMHSYHWDQKKE
ncbi:glycosyltransferase family 2 protein [Deinococcus daejeonensis]|uniref:glycosyltransferase family 2 protein n=1 Tax=Deinococcus daejeonensis TaxID=1007098 RepID=UPI00166F0ADB|nr:glycosyltransferase [Deinococcus daejeonensis]